MCNYGSGRNLIKSEAIELMNQVFCSRREQVQDLHHGTSGSILDEAEMPRDVLEAVLERVARENIPTVILETHYTTITSEIIQRIQELLPDSELVIELGFESADLDVLHRCLRKFMDLDQLALVMEQLRQAEVGVVLNAFLGAPGLTPREQLEDTKKAIRWGYDHGADRVVIFPANIKPNTLLWEKYQQGLYPRISHWLLVELLSALDDELLARVEVSWFGDRQQVGKCIEAIPPASCPVCNGLLMTFYQEFMETFDVQKRRQLLNRLCVEASCNCQEETQKALR